MKLELHHREVRARNEMRKMLEAATPPPTPKNAPPLAWGYPPPPAPNAEQSDAPAPFEAFVGHAGSEYFEESEAARLRRRFGSVTPDQWHW